jgi:hypothetical protein
MSHYEMDLMSPAIEALHAARSALTVAGGRVALAQRHMDRGDALDRIACDLATVPEHLALIASAIDHLAQAALACERTGPFAGLALSSEAIH